LPEIPPDYTQKEDIFVVDIGKTKHPISRKIDWEMGCSLGYGI